MEECYFVDLEPERKSVSISSVDSEPIKPSPKVKREKIVKVTESNENDNDAINEDVDNDNSEDFEDDSSISEESEQDTRRILTNGSKVEKLFVDAGIENECAKTQNHSLPAQLSKEETVQQNVEVQVVEETELQIPLERVSEAVGAVVLRIRAHDRIIIAESVGIDCVAFDIGTIFCLQDGRVIGKCVSVLGPVAQPYYVISPFHNFDMMVKEGTLKTQTELHCDVITQKVIHDLEVQCDRAKGTDASYIDDVELPEHVEPDFSDDEEEYRWKKAKLEQNAENKICNKILEKSLDITNLNNYSEKSMDDNSQENFCSNTRNINSEDNQIVVAQSAESTQKDYIGAPNENDVKPNYSQ